MLSQVDKEEEEAANRLDPLPAKLLNNAAVLHMRGGEPASALELMQEAVQVTCLTSIQAILLSNFTAAYLPSIASAHHARICTRIKKWSLYAPILLRGCVQPGHILHCDK